MTADEINAERRDMTGIKMLCMLRAKALVELPLPKGLEGTEFGRAFEDLKAVYLDIREQYG